MDRINPSIADVLLIALVGFITVFVVLVVLMGIITLISSMFGDSKKKAPKKAEPMPESAPAPVTEETVDTYTGVKLIGVTDKEAALLMAIVADDLKKPLDNLRFISIKEVK